jgi:hypothetical protein
MSRVPHAPLYLGCARSARPLPRGFTGHVGHPIRFIVLTSYFLVSPNVLIPNSSFLLSLAPCSFRKLSHQPHRASLGKQVLKIMQKNLPAFLHF